MYPFRRKGCDLTWSIVKYHRFSTNAILGAQKKSNYYSNLEIDKGATQGEIKAAYYKLSKLYHPDKNKGSEKAANKFREITAAYEVLGNIRTRKLYDRGLSNTETVYESPGFSDEPYTKSDDLSGFEKTRHHKQPSKIYTGRTDAYNFDEWTRNHYSMSFFKIQESRNKATSTRDRDEFYKEQDESLQSYTPVLVILFVLLVSAVLRENHDNPALVYKRKEQAQPLVSLETTADTKVEKPPEGTP